MSDPVPDNAWLVAEGALPSFTRLRSSVTLNLVIADPLMAEDGTTVLKTANRVACEMVAAQLALQGIRADQLFAVQVNMVDAVELEPTTTFESAVVQLTIPAPPVEPPSEDEPPAEG